MYIAVCDDQIEELEKVMGLLQAWQTDRRAAVRLRSFRSAGELLDAAQRERFTLYLLDVLMPGVTGMEAAREIRSFDDAADIVFLTTSPGFAYESYGVRALEYLLKPVSYADFLSAAQKAQRQFELERGAVKANVSVEERSIFVKTDYKIVQIHLDSVLYLEGVKDYVRIHTDDGPVMTLMSMKAMEDALPDTRFIRVHRSFIVNLDRVTTIERNRIVFGKVYIPITDSYKDRFMEILSRRLL